MGELWRRKSSGFENQHVFVSVRKMILPANDVADAQVSVVGARSQMIGRHAVGAQQCEVLDIGPGLHLFAVHSVCKLDDLSLAWHAEAQRKRLSRGSTAIAFLPRKFPHARVEQPCPLCARFLAVTRMGGREIAISKAFLKNGLGHLPVQGSTL